MAPLILVLLLSAAVASGKHVDYSSMVGSSSSSGGGGHVDHDSDMGGSASVRESDGSDFGGMDSGSGSSSSSGSSSEGTKYRTQCTMVYDDIPVDRCEHYSEKVCYSTHHETCDDVADQSCRGIVSSKQIRQCFNVTEMQCGLKEEIRYDVVQAVYTVQKCHKVTERVCDTVYSPQFAVKDDFQCITVRNPVCHSEEHTVVDNTCRTKVNFDCSDAIGAASGLLSAGGSSGHRSMGMDMGSDHHDLHNHHMHHGDDHHDHKNDPRQHDDEPHHDQDDHHDHMHSSSGYPVTGGSMSSGGYPTSGVDSAYPMSGSSSSGGYSAVTSGYGEVKHSCKKSYDKRCYTTPRTMTKQVCSDREEKVCEKLQERVPSPSEKQVCHDEEKKACELEQRQQPKQIKKYVYTKQCRAVPRRVCESADVKQLMPSCVPTARKVCSFSPREKCEQVPKTYCYKVAKRVQRRKCEAVAIAATASTAAGAGGYPSASSVRSADGGQGYQG